MMEIVNQATQDELLDLMGPEEFQELLQEAAQEFAASTSKLLPLLDAADWAPARALAHKVKGSMGSLGYDALFATLDALEKRLLAQPVDAPDAADVARIRQVIDDTRAALPAV